MAVVDASVMVSALAPDEKLAHALDLIAPYAAGGACAPSFWPIEVANAFASKERRGLMSRSLTMETWRLAMDMPVELIETSVADISDGVLPLAFDHGLTVYDALYLNLAIARRVRLVTLDRRLFAAARAAGVATA